MTMHPTFHGLRPRRSPFVAALVLLLSCGGLPAGGRAAGGDAVAVLPPVDAAPFGIRIDGSGGRAAPAGSVGSVLAGISGDAGEPLWGAIDALAALGPPAQAELETAATAASRPRRARIACAGALLRIGRQREGSLALEQVILDHEAPIADRIEAAEYLGGVDGGDYAAARLGLLANLDTLPERVRVALAAGLLRLAYRGQDLLKHLYENAKGETARQEALLALATVDQEIGRYEKPLAELARRPGPLGDRARAQIALNMRYVSEIRREDSITRLIGEVIDRVRHTYNKDETDPDEDKQLSIENMQSVAARAILQSIDPYNDYMDEEDLETFMQSMNAHYGGIGAWVGMRDKRFTILTPMYNQPAQLAGLRPMDIVTHIDSVELKEKKQNDIIKMLKGPPDTRVKLKVIRRGWNEPVEFNIKRKLIQMESVERQILPGGLGYMRIIGFNDGDPRNKVPGTRDLVRQYLEEFEKAGVKGVVLDLTNNPGGLLIAAVDTARLFLGDNRLIVTSKGRPDSARPQQSFHARSGPPPFTMPVTVMINKGSASAAEILAGALKDHGRAKLVGQTTFGKGSVQQAINVWTTRNKTNIKLTIAKYYLPNGECIHRTGIKPDIEVNEPMISAAEAESRFLLRDRHEIQFWLEENGRWDRENALLRRLLAYDGGDPARYDGLDALLAKLKEKHPKQFLDREVLRKEIRHGVASYLRDFLGEPWYVDWMESYTLQEALLALGEAIGGLPDRPEYEGLKDRVLKNRERAKLEKEETEADEPEGEQ